ncbi:MAG: DUF1127 domain-containing protein [Pseudomonadota bacterium]
MSVKVQTYSVSTLVSALHAVASFVEELGRMFRRWNAARRTSDALHGLNAAQLRDLGLEGVDLDALARKLAR